MYIKIDNIGDLSKSARNMFKRGMAHQKLFKDHGKVNGTLKRTIRKASTS